jgi:hypothetical protein
LQAFNGAAQGETRAGDGGGTGAAIGGEDITVDPKAAGSECLEVGDGAQAAAEQALDFRRPAIDLATGGVTRLPVVG